MHCKYCDDDHLHIQARVGKYHIVENIKNIMIFFDIFDIFQKMKISNKLYNNGCNTLMQHFNDY